MKTRTSVWFKLVEKKSNLVNEYVYDAFNSGEDYEAYLVLLEAIETTDLSVAVQSAQKLEEQCGVPLEIQVGEPQWKS